MDISSRQEFLRTGPGVGGAQRTDSAKRFSPKAYPTPLMAALAKSARQTVENTSLERHINLLFKRLFDIAISAILLAFLSPLLVMIAVLIKSETPGAAIFRQERWGRNQTKIRIYKFRTMFADRCDASGTVQVVPHDTRVTRVGAILRRTNIDELPQLLNILKGDMSLIGPRCHPVGMRAVGQLYEDFIPQYHTRHLMKPGIAGLAQAKGFRGATVMPVPARKRIENDLAYIANFSFASDMRIIAQTIIHELFRGTGN